MQAEVQIEKFHIVGLGSGKTPDETTIQQNDLCYSYNCWKPSYRVTDNLIVLKRKI